MGRVSKIQAAAKRRPMPPQALLDDMYTSFAPAPAVLAWIQAEILEESGALFNAEHQHLLSADLEVLWANGGFVRQGRGVIGTAEQVTFRASPWVKLRQEQQMREWFRRVPDWLITLDAQYCAHCSDSEFCALVEHEMYHIAQKLDAFGQPAFTQEGSPKLELRGHDVEEFVGVVRRYGPGAPDSAVSALVRAAQAQPLLSRAAIGMACGTCMAKVA